MNLAPYEQRIFNDLKGGQGVSEKTAYEIIINTVEGDISQLSPELRNYAIKNKLIEVTK